MYNECLSLFPDIKSTITSASFVDERDREILQLAMKTQSSLFMAKKKEVITKSAKQRLHSEIDNENNDLKPKKKKQTISTDKEIVASSLSNSHDGQTLEYKTPAVSEPSLSQAQIQALTKLSKTLKRLSQITTQSKGATNIELPEIELAMLKDANNISVLDLMLQQLSLHTLSDQAILLLCKFFMDSKVSYQQSRSFIFYVLYKKVCVACCILIIT